MAALSRSNLVCDAWWVQSAFKQMDSELQKQSSVAYLKHSNTNPMQGDS